MNQTMKEIARAAFIIARRDFMALVTSKAFIFFLVGPLIMFGIAIAAGGVGSHMTQAPPPPVMAVAMPHDDAARLVKAQARLAEAVDTLPDVEQAPLTETPEALLHDGRDGKGYAAVLSGSLGRPVLTATTDIAHGWSARVRLMVDAARADRDLRAAPLVLHAIAVPVVPEKPDRAFTAQIGQTVLFLTTMLLAGMVLSNLVEEKTNKIIEILAASIPMESIFLGKLFSMLAMALLAIGLWALCAGGILLLLGSAAPVLPPPAVGWPLFLLLGALYFSTAYLLLGSLFLGIGAMAATVRDVQTLSMPVSMGQLGVFLIASYTLSRLGQPVEIAACLFPFTSPFTMLARAAQEAALWPHLLALLWQGLWTWLIVRAGTALFRRNVFKSRGAGRFGRKRAKARPV